MELLWKQLDVTICLKSWFYRILQHLATCHWFPLDLQKITGSWCVIKKYWWDSKNVWITESWCSKIFSCYKKSPCCKKISRIIKKYLHVQKMNGMSHFLQAIPPVVTSYHPKSRNLAAAIVIGPDTTGWSGFRQHLDLLAHLSCACAHFLRYHFVNSTNLLRSD